MICVNILRKEKQNIQFNKLFFSIILEQMLHNLLHFYIHFVRIESLQNK